jgi:transposase
MAKKKWSPEQKQKIVLAGLKNEMSIAELCRRHGVSDALYYKWKKTFLESGLNGLKSNGKVTSGEAALQRENEDLKALIGELTVENRFLKKIQGS